MPPFYPQLLKKLISFLFTLITIISSSYCQVNNPLINSGELIKQGIQLHDQGKYKEAIAIYRQVPRSDTNYHNALYELSLSAYNNNQFEDSKKYAEEGLKLFPERADEFYLLIASALDNLDKPQDAVDLYEKMIKLYPSQYNTYFNKGISLRTLKRYEDAKAAFQKALMINSLHPSSHYYLGRTYLEEGNLIPAMLAFQTYLLIAPSGRYSKNAVQYLSEIAKVTDDVAKYTKARTISLTPEFDLIQQIVLSKIALDKQYKLNTKLEDAIVRQIQVVLEKLEYNKNDKSFAMQFYVPFYTGLIKTNLFEPMVYQMFSGLNIADVDTWNKKHKSEVENFTNYGSPYFIKLRTTQVLDLEERSHAKMSYVYSDGKMFAKGIYIDEEKQLPGGEWEFYNPATTIKSKGLFDAAGNRIGEWLLYYPDGSIQEKINYKEGKKNGIAQGWFKNGNPWYTEYYYNDLLDGLQTIYYYNGNLKSETKYKADKKDGLSKECFSTGLVRVTANFKEDKREGLTATYYKHGVTESVWNYKNDMAEGPLKNFSENSLVAEEGNAIEGKKEGLWNAYYENGKLKEKTTYIKGDITGEYFQYFKTGTISQKGNYYKGKADGKVELYDEDGKISSDYVYDKGKLKEVNFYDKSGKIISSTGTRKGAATIIFYDPSGVKTSEGYYNKEGNKDGVFTYYYPSGKISNVENYKDGELNGNVTGFYSSGNKKFENQYIKDVQDGYAKNYYPDSKIKYEGWIKDGQKQGVHINYDQFGNVLSKENYLNDELNNYSEFYYPGAKQDYEYKYYNGWLELVTQYDTAGNILVENNLKKGTGPLIFRHYTGKNMVEGNYKNYELDGIYNTFYFDGSPQKINYYKHGEYDSIFHAYYFGGVLKVDGKYKYGNRVGVWKYYFENGKISEEESYQDGKLNGQDKYYNEDGSLDKIVTYEDGQLNGPYLIYGENSKMAVQLNYKDGLIKSYTYEDKAGQLIVPVLLPKASGKITAYYPNGNQSTDIDILDGNINGVRKIFFTTGKLYIDGTRKEEYDEGTKKIYFPNGILNVEQNYLNGTLHGVSKTFYPSGKIQIEQNFYNGDLHGTTRYYDEQGKIKQTKTYYYNILLTSK